METCVAATGTQAVILMAEDDDGSVGLTKQLSCCGLEEMWTQALGSTVLVG